MLQIRHLWYAPAHADEVLCADEHYKCFACEVLCADEHYKCFAWKGLSISHVPCKPSHKTPLATYATAFELSEWRRNTTIFRQKPIDKQGESEIRTWILECWVGGDKISIRCWVLECWQWRWDPRNVKPSRGSSTTSLEMRTLRGFGFLLSGKRREK